MYFNRQRLLCLVRIKFSFKNERHGCSRISDKLNAFQIETAMYSVYAKDSVTFFVRDRILKSEIWDDYLNEVNIRRQNTILVRLYQKNITFCGSYFILPATL